MQHLHWGSGVTGVGFEGSIDLRRNESVYIGRIEEVVEAGAKVWSRDGGAATASGGRWGSNSRRAVEWC
jgi:hypothetical protein